MAVKPQAHGMAVKHLTLGLGMSAKP